MELSILLALCLHYLNLFVDYFIGEAWKFISRLFMLNGWHLRTVRYNWALSWWSDHHHSVLLSHCSISCIGYNILWGSRPLCSKGVHPDNGAFLRLLRLTSHLLSELQELLVFNQHLFLKFQLFRFELFLHLLQLFFLFFDFVIFSGIIEKAPITGPPSLWKVA